MEIIKVDSKKELRRFILLPFKLYRDDPNWVPPLIMEQKKFFNPAANPYFEHSEVALFNAYKNGKVVGRISAHTNRQHNQFHQDKVGFFGFFEAINDDEVASGLLEKSYQWLKSKGCDTMRGPMNFSTNDELGFQLTGYDSPSMVMMTHTKPYYIKLMERAGWKKAMDLYAYYLPVSQPPERLARLAERLEKKGNFTIRCLSNDKKSLKRDIETIFTIYTRAWERNWGFVPMTPKEFDHTVKSLMDIIMPEFVFIAEVNGEPAGFSVTLPDYNFVLKKIGGRLLPFGLIKALYYKNKIPGLRVITMGVVKEFQNRGIDVVFYYRSFLTANNHRQNFRDAEFSWVLENNTMMNRVAHSLGGEVYKSFRIFDKKIR